MKQMPFFTMLCAIAALALAAGPSMRSAAATGLASDAAPLTAAEIRALVERVVANQHRDDEALGFYERREHRMVWDSEEHRKVEEDKLYRVVPTGTGTIKLLLADRGKPPSPADYRKQLLYLQQALVWALDPNESKQKQRVQKWEKKEKERRETVEAVLSAFHFKWLGRETRDGRALVKLRFEPAPNYEPTSRATDMLAHSVADVWIEPDAAQLVRVEAQLARDFNIAAGFFGKVYKGGVFTMEQAPVGDGVWLPTEMRYDFKGRKFVFGFALYEQIRSSQYHRIGPPAQALAAVRRELTGPRASQ